MQWPSPAGATRSSVHSRTAGFAATRGGATTALGSFSRPARTNSSTPGPTGADVVLRASARARSTSDTVNCPGASLLNPMLSNAV